MHKRSQKSQEHLLSKSANTSTNSTDFVNSGIPNSAMAALMGNGDTGSPMPELESRVLSRLPGIGQHLQAQIPQAENEADRLSAAVNMGTPDAIKAVMGQRMGADFSGVRFHTDADAAARADAMGARAYTSGADVYFGSGGFDPSVAAHELVHTAQQGMVSSSTPVMSTPVGGVQMKPNLFKRMWHGIKNFFKGKPKDTASAQNTDSKTESAPPLTEMDILSQKLHANLDLEKELAKSEPVVSAPEDIATESDKSIFDFSSAAEPVPTEQAADPVSNKQAMKTLSTMDEGDQLREMIRLAKHLNLHRHANDATGVNSVFSTFDSTDEAYLSQMELFKSMASSVSGNQKFINMLFDSMGRSAENYSNSDMDRTSTLPANDSLEMVYERAVTHYIHNLPGGIGAEISKNATWGGTAENPGNAEYNKYIAQNKDKPGFQTMAQYVTEQVLKNASEDDLEGLVNKDQEGNKSFKIEYSDLVQPTAKNSIDQLYERGKTLNKKKLAPIRLAKDLKNGMSGEALNFEGHKMLLDAIIAQRGMKASSASYYELAGGSQHNQENLDKIFNARSKLASNRQYLYDKGKSGRIQRGKDLLKRTGGYMRPTK